MFFLFIENRGEAHKVQFMCTCMQWRKKGVYSVGAEDKFMKFVGDNATPYTNKIMKHVGA